MIKLIATDMDGSLLDSQKRFPPRFFETMDALQQQGVVFVAATGRSYPKQRVDFAPAATEPYFLCDNGALLMHRDEVLFSDWIAPEELNRMVDVLDALPEVEAVFCGEQGAWHHPVGGAFDRHLKSYFIDHHEVEDLHDLPDRILKIAVCDLRGSAGHSYPVMEKAFGERFNVVVSGPLWMDVMNKGINKGQTLAFLQRQLGIAPEETVAFGDYYNDVEMLGQAEYSFVMENAGDDMKRHGNFIAPHHDEYGVQQVLEQILQSGKPLLCK